MAHVIFEQEDVMQLIASINRDVLVDFQVKQKLTHKLERLQDLMSLMGQHKAIKIIKP